MRQSAGNRVANKLSATSPAHETIEGPLATLSACVARVRSPILLKTTSCRLKGALGAPARRTHFSIAMPRMSRNVLTFGLFLRRFRLRYLALDTEG
jgi:hypothetical protein